jgi:hypothetical protein
MPLLGTSVFLLSIGNFISHNNHALIKPLGYSKSYHHLETMVLKSTTFCGDRELEPVSKEPSYRGRLTGGWVCIHTLQFQTCSASQS